MTSEVTALGFVGRLIYPGYVLPIHFGGENLLAFDAKYPRFALHYVGSGTRHFTLRGRPMTVTAPALLCLDSSRPELVHDFQTSAKTLYFDPAVVNGVFTPQNLAENRFEGTTHQDRFLLTPFLGETNRVVSLTPGQQDLVESGLAKVEYEGTLQSDSSWPCRTRSYLIELLFQIRVQKHENWGQSVEDSPVERAFARAFAQVRSRFAEPLSVTELARAAGTNRTTLNDEFRRRTGHSIHSYQIALRLELASALLRDTDLSVSQITPRAGYEDRSHFCRLFRQRFGVRPLEFRERSRAVKELSFRTNAL